jgi:glucokinase
MTWILADVGGTNSRFATSDDLQSIAQVTRVRNDVHSCFEGALDAFRTSAGVSRVSGLCVAVAGPVNGQTARLTNRDWSFDAEALSARFDGAPVQLINDLGALGYALPHIEASGVEALNEAQMPERSIEQCLVIGVGTGMNVAPVLRRDGAVACAQAEAGMTGPSARVAEIVRDYLGAHPEWLTSIEELVSGRGLGRLHSCVAGQPFTGDEVTEAAQSGDEAALRSLTVFADITGAMVQDLRLFYMPSHGIYLAGSVMRALASGPCRDRLVSACTAPHSTLPQVPLSVITQDEAALLGCMAYARSTL